MTTSSSQEAKIDSSFIIKQEEKLLYQSGFLREDNGSLSMIRLLSFMTWFLWSFMIGWQTVTNTYNVWVILAIGSLVFVPKVFQKVVEAKGLTK